MTKEKSLRIKKTRRAARARAKIFGTATRPRLAVFRSNKFTDAQLIDDETGKTLVAVSSRGIKEKSVKQSKAKAVGVAIAKKAIEAGIKVVVFDRRSYQYHGRVAAVAEGAREGGLKV